MTVTVSSPYCHREVVPQAYGGWTIAPVDEQPVDEQLADEQPVDDDEVTGYPALFDRLSSEYDQSGVPFFGVIAAGLVDRLGVQVGERVLDIGSGRGAATFPLARAVGSSGRVDAIDLAPGMVQRLTADVAHLPQVHVSRGDAADPRPPGAAYDVIASSLVIFFLDDPTAALSRWRALLRPAGRVGVATFQPWTGAWGELSDLYDEFAEDPPSDDRWDTDAKVEAMLVAAGFGDVRTETASYEVPFRDVDEWRRWSWATPMGGLWRRTPETSHPEILRRATGILEATRRDDGPMVLEVDARYSLAIA
jgi:SAM-dependent methyltransferase